MSVNFAPFHGMKNLCTWTSIRVYLTLTSVQINLKVANVIFYGLEQYVLCWILDTIFQYIVWLMFMQKLRDFTASNTKHYVWKEK